MDIINQIDQSEYGTPASSESIDKAENELGFPLPDILKFIYLNVANGGIGPGYHILGVFGGHASDEGDTISELYTALSSIDPDDSLWVWPSGLVPFCHWGCAIYSCFDAKKTENPVVWFDPNLREMGEPMSQQFMSHRPSLESWLQGWLDGEDLWAETYG